MKFQSTWGKHICYWVDSMIHIRKIILRHLNYMARQCSSIKILKAHTSPQWTLIIDKYVCLKETRNNLKNLLTCNTQDNKCYLKQKNNGICMQDK